MKIAVGVAPANRRLFSSLAPGDVFATPETAHGRPFRYWICVEKGAKFLGCGEEAQLNAIDLEDGSLCGFSSGTTVIVRPGATLHVQAPE